MREQWTVIDANDISGLLIYEFTKPTQTANAVLTEESETQKADFEKTEH